MATVVDPRTGIVQPSFVPVAKHYGASVVACQPRRGNRKGWATDCTSYLDVWEDVVSMRFGHRRRWCRTHPAARRRAA
jgi:hypothetical protein